MLPTLPDFGHGVRLAASLNGEKKAFSFSPRWSADEARRIQRLKSRVTTQPRRVSGRCTDSGPFTFSMYSQTEGKELPALTEVNGDVSGYRERLFKFVESQSIELSFSERIAPAKGLSYGGKIMLLSGMQPAEEFSTLVHEIAPEARLWTTKRSAKKTETHTCSRRKDYCRFLSSRTGAGSNPQPQGLKPEPKPPERRSSTNVGLHQSCNCF
jgi:hypothetical protein